ncbi:glycosyltransferase family A protein [Ruminococcus sp. HUN007]|uniref:glycosyltransferase family A protein n=1 Tax=Ruminococcus sp. HUN007 TaxID=1514668 RepID=UPI000678D7AC|nr:glycosyltransferase family A protein [Ruminococcus sp. HUN007]
MNILVRLKNAYKYGGIKEILRKTTALGVYTIMDRIIVHDVKKTQVEYGLNRKERKDQIIVSLTSFPKRFSELDLCLKSLVIQKFKPDKIIVYLGSDSRKEMLSEKLLKYENYGVEFRFDDKENLMPHKKYFYAMQEFPDAVTVTADDDVIYPRDWLESLYRSYLKYPNAVSARRVHLMKRNNEEIAPYDYWEDQCRRIRKPSMSLIATGNSGVLYPPRCFDFTAFDIEAIKKTCLRADDIWLKCVEVKKKLPVVWVPNWQVMLPEIGTPNNEKLSDENVFTGTNDEVLYSVMMHLKLSASDFF